MVAVIVAAYWVTSNGLLLLLLLGALYRVVGPPGPGDERAAMQYVGLVAVLGVLCNAAALESAASLR
jgi:hypothetical protein